MLAALLLLQAAAENAGQGITQNSPKVTWFASWIALGFLGSLGLAIIYLVIKQKIDLSSLVSEPTGEASMSRFQLLIFTFVIAASFFLLVVNTGKFPDPPNGVLLLLGISASSYLVSKGIQASSPEGLSGSGPQVKVSPDIEKTSSGPGGHNVQFQAAVTGLDNDKVTWKLDPPTGKGSINASGLYAPPAAPGITGKVTVKAVSVEDVSVSDTATIDLV
jgi:hypothetical protein